MRTAVEVLAERDHVFLGFDGVLCPAPGRDVADGLKVYVNPGLPPEVVASGDPFDVECVGRISARTRPDLDVHKPSPYRVGQAAEALGAFPRQCVMVCGSVAEIEAARAAGVAVIAYAADPLRRAELLALDPDAAVEHLAELRLAG
jgi:hypothetical protein